VRYVTWYDALAYCDWLTDTLKNSPSTPKPLAHLLQREGWRVTLPSEAEWEKAARGPAPTPGPSPARGGGVGAYPWGDDFDPANANTAETGIGDTSAVGCFPGGASPYVILDMSGNVWEWTRSLWGKNWGKPEYGYPYQPGADRENLQAPRDMLRVLRGGSFDNDRSHVRCASRYRFNPNLRLVDLGFRLVVSPFRL